MMSSLRTKYAHELAQELSLRSRLEAELEGAQAQAKMLSAMLARSESRNEEQDRQRAMSAEEEVMWQEEMKGHASAYAQQQAARARAAQMAQAQAQTQVRTTQTPGQAQTATARAKQNGSPGVGAGNGGLEEPFELKAEPTSPTFAATEADGEGAVTGLGISAPSTTAGPQPTPSDPALTVASGSGSGSSPLSTIIKERNKLLSDKRYLKSRMRDAEAQRDRLEAELRSMRPLLVRGAPSKSAAASTLLASAPSSSSLATPGSNAPNTPSGRSQKRDRSRRRRVATMGDAEAEHLLLAARRLRVSHARTTAGRPQSSPSKQTPLLDDDGRPRTPPPRTPRTPRTAQMSNTPRRGGHDGDATVMMTAGGSPRNGAMLPVAHHNGGGSPLARRNGASLGRWGTHERTDSMRSNGGIDELLQAAQTVLNPAERPTLSSQDRQSNSRTRGGSDAEEDEQEEEDGDDGDEAAVSRRHAFPSAGGSGAAATGGVMSMAKGSANLNNESPKRRRVSTSATVGVDLASMSPGKRIARFGTVDGKLGDGMRRLRTSTEGAEPLYHSAEEAGPMSSGVLSQSSGLSALDLLADQAAASQQPSQSSDRSHSTAEEEEDELEVRSDMSYDGMAVDGEAHSHYYPRGAYGHSYAHEESYRHMQQQPPSSQPSSQQQQQQQPSSQASGYTYSTPPLSHGWTSHQPAGPRNGVYAPRGSSPPSSGRYSTFGHGPRISSGDVHLMSAGKASLASSGSAPTLMMMMPESPKAGQKHSAQAKGGNTSPDKRLPYVRWSEEEDRKLRKAIADHGQRWEAVARVVGTRSYHQCRQRYLLMRRKEAAAKESATNNSSSGRSSGSPARHAPSATAAS
ncbi:hypothetical protein FA10DRAFT_270128 [Acaromyces ingoldii]|uniref:Uncharacterized protein n=1 Tax=Acaromyces ingoldii TaxID=215250 RepID=A0A316YA76_9BASI|nr:hypothetical protein FA10DRAFT_270128 [Acaromyces ingoldii]PWN86577.1 hypothetical protein FA10DRAFT_270128 [Acaromyces ingoldii]